MLVVEGGSSSGWQCTPRSHASLPLPCAAASAAVLHPAVCGRCFCRGHGCPWLPGLCERACAPFTRRMLERPWSIARAESRRLSCRRIAQSSEGWPRGRGSADLQLQHPFELSPLYYKGSSERRRGAVWLGLANPVAALRQGAAAHGGGGDVCCIIDRRMHARRSAPGVFCGPPRSASVLVDRRAGSGARPQPWRSLLGPVQPCHLVLPCLAAPPPMPWLATTSLSHFHCISLLPFCALQTPRCDGWVS